MTTRAQALAAAGRTLAQARARRDALSPEEAAHAAFTPGGLSIEELATLIRKQRALAIVEASAA
ncbi:MULTISPECIES: hypothetical protein [unclassified Nonomuraea]|uniref:hypothetical protein n=1 Tax=unclassified Nonomuraea TaxID=2593643 RepID=UPI0033CC369F